LDIDIIFIFGIESVVKCLCQMYDDVRI